MTNKWQWIVSPFFDGFFFISGVIFSPLAFMLFVWMIDHYSLHPQQAAIYLYALFLLLFDQAHIFQTFSRSHFDREEFKRNRKWHIWLPIVVIGFSPLYFALDLTDLIETLFVYLGMYHILKQNMGLMRVYQKKNGEYGGWDHKIDSYLMWSCLTMAISPDVIGMLHSDFNLDIMPLFPWVKNTARGIFAGMIILFYARIFYRYKKEGHLNLPKILFVSVILLHYYFLYIFLYDRYTIPLLVITVVDTIYHDVQYQGWMMHYQKRRWPEKKDLWGRMMIASYCYAGLVFIMYITRDFYPEGVHEFLTLTIMLVVFYHYLVDGMIWKFDKAPELKKIL